MSVVAMAVSGVVAVEAGEQGMGRVASRLESRRYTIKLNLNS